MEQVFFNVPLSKLEPIFKKWIKEAHTELQTKKELTDKRYSIKEAAEILNVTELTIRNHIKKGSIKAQQLGKRKYYILHSELYNALNDVKSLKYKRS
ncbi:helix-turn-helix domain-containing protein [uncultured Kordia sp.]|uniref:helix-turn-helix domain-containing protein n=1 Tax=uncultured Kordia sp. TaxID=507699 RepID=UPI002621B599|nr:helix-turn-helix domain-containing protein [uncultured Kordia sp.]